MLSLRVTPGVASLLDDAASCSSVPEAVREDARKLRGAECIAWDEIKAIAQAYSEANPGKPIYLHQLCSRSDIALQTPPPKSKSPELQARLQKLQEELDNKRYAAMVSDITEKERKADEMRGSILPSSRLQLTFGAHVIVTMFTFWAVSYYGSKYYLAFDELWAGLTGALGLTAGLLVETGLLIIRTNRLEPLEERMPELFDAAKIKEAFARVKEMDREQKSKAKAKAKGGAAAKQQAPAAAGGSSGAPVGGAGGAAESKKGR